MSATGAELECRGRNDHPVESKAIRNCTSLEPMPPENCADGPTGIHSLPMELIQTITSLLPAKDRASLLLSAPNLLVNAIEHLVYEEIQLSDTQLERNTVLLRHLYTRPDLAAVTRTLNIDLHGCDVSKAESCAYNLWERVVGGTAAPDVVHGSCGCCQIEWKDALLPQIICSLPHITAVNFMIHPDSWKFHENFYRIFHATSSLTLSSLVVRTPNTDIKTRGGLSGNDVTHLLNSQPSLRHLALICHVTISTPSMRLKDTVLPHLESFSGFFNCWRIVGGRPVSKLRMLCELGSPTWAPSQIVRRVDTLSMGTIRDVTVVVEDGEKREIEWEKEPFAIAVLRWIPTLQRLVVENLHSKVEVPFQTMDLPAFLASLDPNDYPP